MSEKKDAAGWIARRMDELEKQTKNWPTWKKADLDERLKHDPLRCPEPDANRPK